MFPGPDDILPFLAIFGVPLVLVVLATPAYSRWLVSRGMVTTDVHKKEQPKIPTPAGPLLVVALVVGELLTLLLYGSIIIPLAVTGVVLVAAAVGVADDLWRLGGKVKPILLVLAASPLLIGEAIDNSLYDPRLFFPIFGAIGTHFIIYGLIILATIPVVGNAFNMMDAFNGEISGFTIVSSLAVFAALLLRASSQPDYPVERIAVALPLVAVAMAFHIFNRYPSKIFDGDSGSLSLGAMYGSIAFVGGVEFAAIVAIIPAIVNSFYILSSVKRVVEHREIATRPTYLGEDEKLHATPLAQAPTTLVRMLLLDGALTEKEIVRRVLVLTAFAAVLSLVTSVLTWVV